MAIENFTPWTGLAGGALIGLSAAVLLLFNGDILGASGIVSSAFLQPATTFTDPNQQWKLALLATFMLLSSLYLGNTLYDMDVFASARPVSMVGYALGGFFVGSGTRLGNGCTTGHGICGLARLSKRSFVAVMTFMGTAIFVSHLTAPKSFLNGITGFLRTDSVSTDRYEYAGIIISIIIAVLALLAPIISFYHGKTGENTEDGYQLEGETAINARAKLIPAAVAGLLFAFGLYVSEMVYPSKVLDFLNFSGIWGMHGTYWDPTLMFVMGGGLIISWISYQFLDGFAVVSSLQKLTHPISCKTSSCEFGVPKSSTIDWQLVTGAVLFGVGWGIAGLCPGPAMFLAATGIPSVLFSWWPSFFIGSFLAMRLKTYLSAKEQQAQETAAEKDNDSTKKSGSTQEISMDLEGQK